MLEKSFRIILCLFVLIPFCRGQYIKAQNEQGTTIPSASRMTPSTPRFAIKSNLLYDATASFNLGVEMKVGRKLTLDIPVNYNPWTFHENRKWKHLLVQPELRYWICEPFHGHHLGIHAHYGLYNVGNLPFGGKLKDSRYEGWLAGAGLSYGYQWTLSNRWSLEAGIGVGYAYLDYDKYPCGKCGDLLSSDKKHYVGITKAAVSIIYVLPLPGPLQRRGGRGDRLTY